MVPPQTDNFMSVLGKLSFKMLSLHLVRAESCDSWGALDWPKEPTCPPIRGISGQALLGAHKPHPSLALEPPATKEWLWRVTHQPHGRSPLERYLAESSPFSAQMRPNRTEWPKN